MSKLIGGREIVGLVQVVEEEDNLSCQSCKYHHRGHFRRRSKQKPFRQTLTFFLALQRLRLHLCGTQSESKSILFSSLQWMEGAEYQFIWGGNFEREHKQAHTYNLYNFTRTFTYIYVSRYCAMGKNALQRWVKSQCFMSFYSHGRWVFGPS